MCREALGVVWPEQAALCVWECCMEFWVCYLAQRCQELLHAYKSLKFKIFLKRFSSTRNLQALGSVQFFCSHSFRALASMASLQSLDGCSTEGPVQSWASKQTSVTFHTHWYQSHIQSFWGSAHSRGQDILEWCLVLSSRKFVHKDLTGLYYLSCPLVCALLDSLSQWGLDQGIPNIFASKISLNLSFGSSLSTITASVIKYECTKFI